MLQNVTDDTTATKPGFDAEMAGKRAECDGGGALAGTRLVCRQEFTGVLTGEYVDHGDPPWRWYLMGQLSNKPEGYPWDTVWCESGSIFVQDE